MKIIILDDYHDTIRTLPCFAMLAGHEVAIYNDHVQDTDVLAERLRDTEALVLIRERTKIRTPLLERLPKLRLISQRSVFPHIDIEFCTRLGIIARPICSWHAVRCHCGADVRAHRGGGAADPAADGGVAGRQVAVGVGHTLRQKTLGIYGYGRIGSVVAGYGRAFGMDILVWAREAARARAVADGHAVAASKVDFYARADVISLHM